MSATDELRKLLDERGIMHKTDTFVIDADHGKVKETAWVNGDSHYVYQEYRDRTVLTSTPITPEQAIAATLGRGMCEWILEHSGTLYDKWRCSKCGYLFVESRVDQGIKDDFDPNYCPNCERKVVSK